MRKTLAFMCCVALCATAFASDPDLTVQKGAPLKISARPDAPYGNMYLHDDLTVTGAGTVVTNTGSTATIGSEPGEFVNVVVTNGAQLKFTSPYHPFTFGRNGAWRHIAVDKKASVHSENSPGGWKQVKTARKSN